MSLPAPPSIISLPLFASIVSPPPPPCIVSIPAPPVIVKFSLWPVKVTTDPLAFAKIVSMFFSLLLSEKIYVSSIIGITLILIGIYIGRKN